MMCVSDRLVLDIVILVPRHHQNRVTKTERKSYDLTDRLTV